MARNGTDNTLALIMTAAASTLADGGGTFDSRTLRPANLSSQGYIVAVATNDAAEVVAARPSAVTLAIISIRRRYPETRLIGTWVNPETGLVHVDPVVRLFNRADALRVARALGQRAIYELATQTAIEVA
jgi:hypothetical protein